jgi:alpha-ribazole phosphatase
VAPTRVHLVRHGEVEGAAERRFFGHTDAPLSVTGQAQAEALGALLEGEGLEAIYTSDLRRARESAAPLARRLGLAPVDVPELREMAMGRWEGLTLAQIEARDPDLAGRWLADPVAVPFPGGESLADLERRVMPAFLALVARHPGGRVAVVAHGGTNRVILARALGWPLDQALRVAQDYAGTSLVEYGPGPPTVLAVNRRVPGPAGLPPVESRLGGRS